MSPWWLSTPDIRRFPVLSTDLVVDIVVIGGGIVGALTAWKCAQTGAQVALIEKHHVATGDTGFSTAFVLRVPDASFHALRQKLGTADFRKLWTELTAAQEELRQLATTKNLGHWSDGPSLFGSFRERDEDLAKEWAAVHDVDISAEWVSGDQARPYAEAIRFNQEARMDPRAFVVDLLKHAPPNLRIFEETAITAIGSGQPATLTTSSGTITAKNVIVATGSPFELLSDLRLRLSVSVTYVMTAKYAAAAPVPDAVGWNTDVPYHYFRRLDERTLMVGGADQTLGDHQARPDRAWEDIEQFRRRRFPGSATTEQRWSGTLSETPDALPMVGPVPERPNIYIATGFSGNGIIMGAVASRMLAAAVAGQSHPLHEIFSPLRTAVQPIKTARHEAPVFNNKKSRAKWWIGLGAIAAGLVAFISPTVFFFTGHHGQLIGKSANLAEFSQHLFPLLGLYAFTLVWIQVMIGSLTPLWRRYWPRVTTLHRWLGVFALLFAILHPLFLFVGVGWTVYLARTYVAPHLVVFVWLGYFQLLLIITTASTALLMRWPWLRKHWRTIHLLNYVVFYSVLVHSLALGHDVGSSALLRGLWYAYGLMVTIALIFRLKRKPSMKQVPSTTSHQVDLGPISDFPDQKMKLVSANKVSIVVIRSGEHFWAMDNQCSHAGGPLCEGVFDGKNVTCPWHGSQFNVADGAVVRGPATSPQHTYPVEMKSGRVVLSI